MPKKGSMNDRKMDVHALAARARSWLGGAGRVAAAMWLLAPGAACWAAAGPDRAGAEARPSPAGADAKAQPEFSFSVRPTRDKGRSGYCLDSVLASSGPVTVWAEGASGREQIHQGWVEAGTTSFVWIPAGLGEYKVTLQTRHGRQVRWVKVERQ